MWIEGLKNAMAMSHLMGTEPRLMLEHSLVYPGMTSGLCWPAPSSSPIPAPFPIPYPFEQKDE